MSRSLKGVVLAIILALAILFLPISNAYAGPSADVDVMIDASNYVSDDGELQEGTSNDDLDLQYTPDTQKSINKKKANKKLNKNATNADGDSASKSSSVNSNSNSSVDDSSNGGVAQSNYNNGTSGNNTSGGSNGSGLPQTSDQNMVLIWFAGALVLLSLIMIILAVRRRQ